MAKKKKQKKIKVKKGGGEVFFIGTGQLDDENEEDVVCQAGVDDITDEPDYTYFFCGDLEVRCIEKELPDEVLSFLCRWDGENLEQALREVDPKFIKEQDPVMFQRMMAIQVNLMHLKSHLMEKYHHRDEEEEKQKACGKLTKELPLD